MSLRKLERELEEMIAERRRQVAEANRRRLESEPISSVVERIEKYSPEFTLEPVFEYIDRIKSLPRQMLEARYCEEFRVDCPSVERWWIEEAIQRKFQNEYYQRVKGEIPASVQRNNRRFRFSTRPYVRLGEGEADEPADRSFRVDPETRLVIGDKDCPFHWGRKWEAYNIVALARERGVSYGELVFKIVRALDEAKPAAEKLAVRMFTAWVEKKIMKLKVVTIRR